MSRRELLIRVARLVATFLLVTLATAFLLELAPGDAAYYIAGESATPEQIEAVRREYDLDRPLIVRYGNWLGDFVQGELGRSHVSRLPVASEIADRLPVTLQLAVMSTVLALAVAIPLAVASTRRAGSRFDSLITGVTTMLISIPVFVIGVVLAYVFALRTKVLPLQGWTPFGEGMVENLKSAVLPVVSIALGQMAIMQRVLRADLVTTLQQDFILLARAKGLSQRRILWYHALKPSSFSLLTLSALSFAALLGGTVIVESIFRLPGLGSYLLQSIQGKDLVAVQGVVAFLAVIFLVTNFLVDLLYGVLDPRTRSER